jgi:FG-GAP-like repeat
MLPRFWFLLAASPVVALSLVVPACGSDDTTEPDTEPPGFGADATLTPSVPPCTTGSACGDGGVCTGPVCCAASLACGDVCGCATGRVCSFQQCVVPGAICHESSDCSTSEYCEFSLGTSTDGGTPDAGAPDSACVGGADRTGRCLPKPPECASDAGPSAQGALSCLSKCEYKPKTDFTPVQKLAWGGQIVPPFGTDVMMAPIVIELDDDDCDGKVTARDIPEIVFATFESGNYTAAGTLHAVSVVGGVFVEKWSAPSLRNTAVVNPTKQIAGGNFDGIPGNEVVACGEDGAVHAFRGTDGAPLWTSPPVDCFMPAIADLEGDGTVEVIVDGAILNGSDGTVKHVFTPALNGPFVVSDIDGSGGLDVVTSSRGYHADGTMFVDTGLAETAGGGTGTSDWKGPWAGIGDFDKDGKPEIVAVDNMAHSLLVWRFDAAAPGKFVVVRAPVDMNAQFPDNTCADVFWGYTHGGGPPTIADFDNDGIPDVGLAGGIGYVVFDGKKLVNPAVAGTSAILWSKPTSDCSSASTGSTVFDFDGDGRAEVVYSDETRLRIYDGQTGTELASICNTTATLIEFPVVADVDNDGHADIVVASNGWAGKFCNDGVNNKQAGVRVFGDANGSWVRSRRVWNEHTYHVTNVAEDGTVPTKEASNWTQPGLNNFRQNKQPGSEFVAPNLIVSVGPVCPGPRGLKITVRNVGQASVPAGVVVGVYAGAPPNGTKLGTITTTHSLDPAEMEPLELDPPAGMPVSAYAIVDDNGPSHPSWHECRTDDNFGVSTDLICIAAR